jgi:hypothetical protein
MLVWRLTFGSVVSGLDRNHERRIHHWVRRSLFRGTVEMKPGGQV